MFPLGNIGLKKFKIFFSILRYKTNIYMAKVFVGTWVDKKNRIDFKMKCAELELNQEML